MTSRDSCLQNLTCPSDFGNGNCFEQIVNPLAFFYSNNIDLYANTQMCNANNVLNTSNFNIGDILYPFCLNLLPFCVTYSFMRFLISFVSLSNIYFKNIRRKIRKVNDEPNINKQQRGNYYRVVLLISYLSDFINATVCWMFFKGFQYYASSKYEYECTETNCVSDSLCLGKIDPDVFLKVIAFVWFTSETITIFTQIFAVSSLTHVGNYDPKEQGFIYKHVKWAGAWALLYFLVAGLLLIHNFSDSGFEPYKLYYKFYSEATVTFWLCYSLVFILVIVDRYLAYEGFKRRVNLQASNVARPDIDIDNRYEMEFKIDETTKNEIELYLHDRFKQIDPLLINTDVECIINNYNGKLKEHIDQIKKYQEIYNDEKQEPNDLSYVVFLLLYHVLHLIAYIIILISYKGDPIYLTTYLCGLLVFYFSTFVYELSHNYLLYKGLFNFMRSTHIKKN